MFCDSCGTALKPDQSYCGTCGKEVVGRGIQIAYPRPSRVASHLRLLGILWLGLSGLSTVGGVFMFIVANTIFNPNFHRVPAEAAFLRPLLTLLAALALAKAFAGFIAGWGLLQRQSWARILTLILAFISLLHPPLGTALGVYTLWVLLPAHADQEYEEHIRAA